MGAGRQRSACREEGPWSAVDAASAISVGQPTAASTTTRCANFRMRTRRRVGGLRTDLSALLLFLFETLCLRQGFLALRPLLLLLLLLLFALLLCCSLLCLRLGFGLFAPSCELCLGLCFRRAFGLAPSLLLALR